jgi:PAS domain S-box-containing protein
MNNNRPNISKESIWQRTIKPSGPFFEPDLQLLRVLAGVVAPLLVLLDVFARLSVRRTVPFGWLDVMLGGTLIIMVAVPFVMKHVAYRAIARTFVVSLLLAVGIIGAVSIELGISLKPVADADFFAYLLLPLLLSSALLPLADTLLLAIGVAIFELVIPLVLPQITFQDMAQSFVFLLLGIPILFFITTHREKLEQLRTNDLRKSEERYRNLADLLPLSIFEADTSGRLTFINQAALTSFGYTLDEMRTSLNITQMVSLEDRDRLIDAVQHILQGETRPRFEYSGRRKDGTCFPITGYTRRMLKDGYPVGVLGVVIDITERKAAEQRLTDVLAALTRSNQDLEQFAYVASHDLQEPLRMVSSYLQLLQKRYYVNLQGEAREFMDYAIDGATRMQGMIHDLLVYSRVNTQAQPLKPVSMQKVYQAAELNLRQVITDSSVVICCDPLPNVMGHESQLVQLLQNLMANSIKFHGDAPPIIHISVKEAGGYWEFGVKDNGIGIDPQFAERIFIIFQRLHGRDKYPGSGIGLAVCKRIVERHGGKIWVESQPGQGSKFIFTLSKEK